MKIINNCITQVFKKLCHGFTESCIKPIQSALAAIRSTKVDRFEPKRKYWENKNPFELKGNEGELYRNKIIKKVNQLPTLLNSKNEGVVKLIKIALGENSNFGQFMKEFNKLESDVQIVFCETFNLNRKSLIESSKFKLFEKNQAVYNLIQMGRRKSYGKANLNNELDKLSDQNKSHFCKKFGIQNISPEGVPILQMAPIPELD